MSARNRVSPLGDVVAAPGRGAWMGNRGVLHDRTGRLTRSWAGRAWITCALSWRGQRLPLLEPGRYTQLFLLDEAVALAAGHRPCARCRRASYDAYRDALGERLAAPALDARLHAERLDGTARRLHAADWTALPDDAVVLLGETPAKVAGDRLLPWLPANAWGDPLPRPTSGTAVVVTPPTSLAALAGGFAAASSG